MKRWFWVALALCAAWGCGKQAIDLGSNNGGDGGSTGSASGGMVQPDKCHGSGMGRDASAGGGPDARAQPAVCSSTADCSPPDVCVMLPGGNSSGSSSSGGGTGFCGNPCQSDCDCPAWLTCQQGLCAQCSTCPAGQQCTWATGPGGGPANCSTNSTCSLGSYCVGSCEPIMICAPCYGPCPACTSNSQCNGGQVCIGQSCQACTSDDQCGPSAKCQATHSGMQCTCTQDADCGTGESCASGICSPGPEPSCFTLNSCQNGQVCINGACGACSSFEDCNTSPYGGPRRLMGLACINGACSACSTNSQCGGGQACVGGTCGTCSTDGQCGGSGKCSNGYCVCTSDSQCQAGQRCGAGVCVEM